MSELEKSVFSCELQMFEEVCETFQGLPITFLWGTHPALFEAYGSKLWSRMSLLIFPQMTFLLLVVFCSCFEEISFWRHFDGIESSCGFVNMHVNWANFHLFVLLTYLFCECSRTGELHQAAVCLLLWKCAILTCLPNTSTVAVTARMYIYGRAKFDVWF